MSSFASPDHSLDYNMHGNYRGAHPTSLADLYASTPELGEATHLLIDVNDCVNSLAAMRKETAALKRKCNLGTEQTKKERKLQYLAACENYRRCAHDAIKYTVKTVAEVHVDTDKRPGENPANAVRRMELTICLGELHAEIKKFNTLTIRKPSPKERK